MSDGREPIVSYTIIFFPMADENVTAPPAAPVAPAATVAEDNLAVETLAKLQALPDVNRPNNNSRSLFMKKFRLLTELDPRRLEVVDKKNATHVCTLCNECLHFNWRRGKKNGVFTEGFGSYDTTKAIKHLNVSCTGGGKDCDEVTEHRVTTEASQKRKMDKMKVNLKQYHAEKGAAEVKGNAGGSNKKQKTQQNIQQMLNPQSYRARALCAQAHFFLYSKSSIPLTMFEDPLFKEMLEAMIPPSCVVDAKDPPILNRFGAAEYANSEFELFKSSLNNPNPNRKNYIHLIHLR